MRRTKISLASSPREHGKRKKKHTASSTTCTSSSPQMIGGEGGHRFGNFQNYYSFHPTDERMKLLGEDAGILDYIANDWKSIYINIAMQPTTTTESKSDPHNPAAKAKAKAKANADELASATKKPRLDTCTCTDPDEKTDLPPPVFQFSYLDVGCNEGDLTMEVAKALASRLLVTRKVKETNAKSEVLGDAPTVRINVHGYDIDPELVHRAQRKNLPADDDDDKAILINNNGGSDTLMIWPDFQVVDVLSVGNNMNNNEDQTFHLTSIFSTTMWIHIHGGDDGLCRVLGTLCRKTKHYLIVEPQPSKW
jgi:Bicoid-interacting protein 3 (Bin3)